MGARRAAAREALDDDHAGAAAWAGMRGGGRWLGAIGVGIGGLGLGRRRPEQLARRGDVVGTGATGEQAVVANAVETARQNMDEEAADELVDGERHHLVSIVTFAAVILPLEGDAVVVECDQPAVGDGDAM